MHAENSVLYENFNENKCIKTNSKNNKNILRKISI